MNSNTKLYEQGANIFIQENNKSSINHMSDAKENMRFTKQQTETKGNSSKTVADGRIFNEDLLKFCTKCDNEICLLTYISYNCRIRKIDI